MNRVMKTLTVGCASAMMLMGATAISASAFYTGYGNGDPGNWDFFEEQAGGAAPQANQNYTGMPHASVQGNRTCGYYHHKALETGRASWWHRYHACERG